MGKVKQSLNQKVPVLCVGPLVMLPHNVQKDMVPQIPLDKFNYLVFVGYQIILMIWS